MGFHFILPNDPKLSDGGVRRGTCMGGWQGGGGSRCCDARSGSLQRMVRRLSDCFPRTLLSVDGREGEVVDALHTFDMAQPLNEAGRQEDDREITLGVDHPCR